jgi:hypothetical protein
MIAALLSAQASAQGVQFFQPPVGGFLSQGSMVSQAPPVPMVPLASNEMAFQPVVVSDATEDGGSDQSGVYSALFVVCALAVAGVTMSRRSARAANRRVRVPAPVMQFGDFGSEEIIRGPADQVMQYRNEAYVVLFNRGAPNEGVYTLESAAGGSKGQLLTFENTEDARRFTSLLQGEQFTDVGKGSGVSLVAQPSVWDTGRIVQFCAGGDFEVALVPAGGKIEPPEKNIFDPARFEERRPSPEEGFQNQRQMGFGNSMWNQAMNQWKPGQFGKQLNQDLRGQPMWGQPGRGSSDGQRGQPMWGQTGQMGRGSFDGQRGPSRFSDPPPGFFDQPIQDQQRMSMWNQPDRTDRTAEYDQRRRAQGNPQGTRQQGPNNGASPLQRRGQDVWAAAMRNANAGKAGNYEHGKGIAEEESAVERPLEEISLEGLGGKEKKRDGGKMYLSAMRMAYGGSAIEKDIVDFAAEDDAAEAECDVEDPDPIACNPCDGSPIECDVPLEPRYGNKAAEAEEDSEESKGAEEEPDESDDSKGPDEPMDPWQ